MHFQEFLQGAQKKVEQLMLHWKEAQQTFEETASFFGDDPKIPIEDFFSQITDFLLNVEKAIKDNVREKRLAERKKQLEEKKKANEEQKAKQVTLKVRPRSLFFLVTSFIPTSLS